MKKYTQEEAIHALQGDRKGLKNLSARTGISETTLRQYRRATRGMSAPVKLLFRMLLISQKRGTLEKVLDEASEIEISGK